MSSVNLMVNGEEQVIDASDDTPLLYVLRNQLKLKCAKFGCGQGYCGACTVVVNGKGVQSCDTPLWSLNGAEVITLEMADKDEKKLAKLRDIFIEEQAAQCGYCIPGIIMAIYSFVRKSGKTREEEIVDYLDERNLCRCGTHLRVIRALRRYLKENN